MRRSPVTIVSLLAAACLSACTSASDVLEPSAIAPQSATAQAVAAADQAGGNAAASSTPTAPAASPAQTAAAVTRTRIQVAPIVGASVEAAAPLTERLQARAKERGITLAGSADQAATHVLKGYFSVLTEGKDTTVIYVWDIYDPSGNRLHRINGQQKAATVGGAQGWGGVAPASMQAIADQTIDQVTTWLAGSAG